MSDRARRGLDSPTTPDMKVSIIAAIVFSLATTLRAQSGNPSGSYFGNNPNSIVTRPATDGTGTVPDGSPGAQPSPIPAELQERINRVKAAEASATGQSSPAANQSDQSEQEATSILTTGCWVMPGTKKVRGVIFQPGGNFIFGSIYSGGVFSERPAYGGTWKITGGIVAITSRHVNEIASLTLPINPAGTRGLDGDGSAETVVRRLDVTKIVGRDYTGTGTDASAGVEQQPGVANSAGGFACNIVEADPISVSVSVGKAGDADMARSYKITDSTKITVDGQAASADNLKGGMAAKVQLAADGVTAVSIDATDLGR